MDKNYVAPAGALKKLKRARSVPQTVYLYGATGYGKTELVRQYLSGRRYTYLSCEELPWEAGALPPEEPGKQNRRVVVIDDLHRLKSEELRLNSGEIAGYLDACGVAHTEKEVQYLQGTAEGNAYVVRHVALKPKEGESLGPELYEEIHEAFSVYLENSVLVRWDSDLLEFLMQVSVVDEFTMELAEMISGSLHVTALLEQAAEAGNFLTQEDGVYRLRSTLIRALRNRAAKVYGRERVRDFKYNAALYYEMHDEVLPALKLFEECGKQERIKNLLIRNARMNPGNGHYYELHRYYFNMDEREIEDSPVLMAGMSMLCSVLMDGEKSEYWYEKLKTFAANAKGGVRREAQSRLAYLDIGLPHRGTSGRKRVNREGEIIREVRSRYQFHYNVRHPGECDGQSGYGVKKLDGIIDRIVRYQLSKICAASGAEIVAKQNEKAIELARARHNVAVTQLAEKQRELADYQGETIKVIRGESRLDIDLLNDLVSKTTLGCMRFLLPPSFITRLHFTSFPAHLHLFVVVLLSKASFLISHG